MDLKEANAWEIDEEWFFSILADSSTDKSNMEEEMIDLVMARQNSTTVAGLVLPVGEGGNSSLPHSSATSFNSPHRRAPLRQTSLSYQMGREVLQHPMLQVL